MRAVALVLSVLVLAWTAAGMARAGVRVGLEGGLNQATATWDLSPNVLDQPSRYRPAWSLGAIVDLPLGSRLSLASGLRYVEYGEHEVVNIASIGGGARFERHWAWRYLTIPVQLRFRPAAARGFFLCAGPEVGYLLTVWHQESDSFDAGPVRVGPMAAGPASQIFEEVGTFSGDPNDTYRRWNLALSGGLGHEFQLARHTGVAEARYTHGLLDMAKSDALTRETRGFEALLGFLW